MTVKGSVLQEDLILDKCAPNSRVSNRVTTVDRTAVREGGSPQQRRRLPYPPSEPHGAAGRAAGTQLNSEPPPVVRRPLTLTDDFVHESRRRVLLTLSWDSPETTFWSIEHVLTRLKEQKACPLGEKSQCVRRFRPAPHMGQRRNLEGNLKVF